MSKKNNPHNTRQTQNDSRELNKNISNLKNKNRNGQTSIEHKKRVE